MYKFKQNLNSKANKKKLLLKLTIFFQSSFDICSILKTQDITNKIILFFLNNIFIEISIFYPNSRSSEKLI